MIILPSNLIAQKNKKNQADPWLVTLDITLPDRTTKLHYVNNTEDLVLSTTDYDAAGCVLHLKMNDAGANTLISDSSDTAATFVLQGGDNTADITAAGRINASLAFDGIADYLLESDVDELEGFSACSFVVWLYPTAAQRGTILVKNGPYSIEMLADRTVKFGVYAGDTPAWTSLTTSGQLTLNTWNLLVCTYDGTTLRVSIDAGAAETQTHSAGGAMRTSGDSIRIGYGGAGFDNFYAGRIDNLMIFGKVLSTAEIALLYNSGDGVETIPLTYTAIRFEIDPIKKTSDKHSPTTKLRVDNVNRFLVPYLRSQDITDGTTIDVKAITTAYKGENYTELTLEFDVLACEVGANWITFTLGGPALLTAPCPDYKYIAQHCRWRFEEVECNYSRKVVAGVTLNTTNPVSIEVTSHGFATGDSIRLAGIAGLTPDMAGNYTITRTDANNFTLNSTDSSDYSGSYTSGGTAGYAVCTRTLSDCRDRENSARFGGFAGIRSGTIQVVG